MKNLFALILIIALVYPLQAQQTDSLLVLDLEPITISTLKIEDRPSFNLLPTESLSFNNGYETQNVLNLVPGVYMHSGTLSTNRITIRGVGNRSSFSTSKIRAYLEDIPITSGIGETSLEDIDLGFIREIEVWKGPTASRFGAGLGGMIHYRLPTRIKSGINIDTQFGSAGLFRNSTSYSNTTESAGSFVLNFNHTSTDGWRQNSNYKRQGLNALWQIHGAKSSLQLIIMAIQLNGQIPSSIDLDDFNDDPSKAAFTWNAIKGFEEYDKVLSGLSYTREMNTNWKVKGSAFFKYRDGYESRPFNILDDGDVAGGSRIVLERSQAKSTLKTGAELYTEKYKWRTYETNGGNKGLLLSDQIEGRNYLNIFQEWQYDISTDWALELGYNLNSTWYTLDDKVTTDGDISGNYYFGGILSPNVNLRYRPSDRHMYYFSTSHGFSSPSLEETLTPEGLINETIGPETGWNFELGSRGQGSDKISFDISVYTMLINNLLVNRFEEDITTGFDQIIAVNAGNTQHTGVDILMNAHLLSSSSSQLNMILSYSLQNYRFKDFIDEDQDYSGNELTGTIPHKISTQLNWSIGKLDANLAYYFVDRMPMRDDNSIYSDSYSLLHFNSKYNFKFGETGLQLYVGINNLLNTNYASMVLINASAFGNNLPRYYYPGQARNFYAGLRMDIPSGKKK